MYDNVVYYQTAEHSAWGSSWAVANARREAKMINWWFIFYVLAARSLAE